MNTDIVVKKQSWLSRILNGALRIIQGIFGIFTPGPSVSTFNPIRGYPGTALAINGANFASLREDNLVTVGGAKALVVAASASQLKVITSLDTVSGPVKVEVGGKAGSGPVDFDALGRPDSTKDGPPILYTGSGRGVEQGAPSTGTLRVLVVLCHASDLTPPSPANTRNAIVTTFGNVHTFYDQASYTTLDVQTDVTNNWRTLDGAINDLMDGDNLDQGRLDQIIAEAAQQAHDEGFNLDNYTLIAAMVYTNQFIRAWGGGSYSNFTYTNAAAGININLTANHALSAIWINETADWGRCAHEVGHCIVDTPGNLSAWPNALVLKEDVYKSDLVDPAAATAAEFDMMGSHDHHPLFSSYYMEQMGYYNASNIRELQWDRNPFNQTYEIVAHGDTQNSLGNRYHIVRIKVTNGLYYYIEVRQRPDPAAATPSVFDGNIPLDGAAHQGGVVVTKVLTDTVNMNQQMRFITLLHEPNVLRQGDVATDPARFLTITVVNNHLVERPLTCQVRVEWAQVIGDTPGGDFDLRVRPWNSNYETPDIWVDRPPYGTYDYTDPSTGEPTGNGDKPQVKKQNKFYGRVHCDGQADASNVRLTFYVVTPPGVGDNGNWGPLETKVIGSITKGNSAEANVIWVPGVGEHTCLKIYAEAQAGEIHAGGNNSAQENIFNFEAAASSVPVPLFIPVAVRNPLKERTRAIISVRNVPEGFIVHFPHSWVWLEPLQERRLELTVIPTQDYDAYHKLEIQHANIVVDGWIPHSYEEEWQPGIHPASCFLPMGGILAQVTPKRKVTLDLREDQEVKKAEAAAVRGSVNPAMAGEVVAVELEDPASRLRTVQVTTDATGHFTAAFDLTLYPGDEKDREPKRETPPHGVYLARAFIVNSPHAAQAESNVVYIIK